MHLIRLAEVGDASGYVDAYTISLIETYAHIMPPRYADVRWSERERNIEHYTARFEAMRAAAGAGTEPFRTHWVAEDEAGRIVGVACAGDGRPDWEFTLNLSEPPISFQLDHLYTRASTHGTGLGQRMLDVALPNRRGAYLWILENNPRAAAFYVRNGFVDDDCHTTTGPTWFDRPMFRMWRP